MELFDKIFTVHRQLLLCVSVVFWLCSCGGSPIEPNGQISSVDSTSSDAPSSTSSDVQTSSANSQANSSVSSSSVNNNLVANTQAGKTEYDTKCHSCHGEDGNSPFSLNNDQHDIGSMVNITFRTMPFNTPNDCDLQCSTNVTAYIKQVLLTATPEIEIPKPLVPRLIKPHYVNSIEDIFGITMTNAEKNLLPKELIDEQGFITIYDTQLLDTSHIRAHAQLARAIAARISPDDLGRNFANCTSKNNNCRNRLVNNLGLRLFRRPLSSPERQHYRDLFTEIGNLDGVGFGPTARSLLTAMLQAPQFLYRLENETAGTGDSKEINAYELASRLSFFLWQSSPDKDLLDFAAEAETNGLRQQALADQVDRLINDTDKIARARTTFWSDYSLSSTSAILEAGADKARDLRQGIVQTLLRATGSRGSEIALQQLFTSTNMTLSPSLAMDLNLDDDASGLADYDTAALPQRVGFLSHPGFIANIGSTSFVGRGVILTERILCREIRSPPDTIGQAIADTANETRNLTPRGAKDHRFNLGGSCLACHSSFEPVAFAFEQLDVLGSYSTTDARGEELFSHGYLQEASGAEGPRYNNVGELMNILAQSDETSRCFAENMMKFAIGRNYVSDEDDAIIQAHSVYVNNGGNFTALLRAVALSPLLRNQYIARNP